MAAWKATREAIAADRRALNAYWASFDGGRVPPPPLPLAFVAMLLYRVARYLFVNGWRRSARLVWLANICITSADLNSRSSIGKGMVIPYPRTVTIYGCVGENCTFLSQSGIGGLLRGPRGLPVVGDNVLVMPGSLILGPINVRRGACIGPRCVVTNDVPEDGQISPLAWQVRRAEVR